MKQATTARVRNVGVALAAVLGVGACGGSTTGTTASALSVALASSTSSAGTLLCAPAQAHIDACSGKLAGDACTFPPPDGGTAVNGMCRLALDGTTVACAPTPPGPPQALVDACTGKAAGDGCTAAEAFGNDMGGTCTTARDGVTLVCGRVHAPPQLAIDACAGQAAGAGCTVADQRSGASRTGSCSYGPAGTGVLACAPAQDLLPHAEAACAGLAESAACTLGRGHETTAGTCTTPAAGGAAVCVVACGAVGGPFDCRGPRGPGMPGGMDGGMGDGGMGYMPGPGHH